MSELDIFKSLCNRTGARTVRNCEVRGLELPWNRTQNMIIVRLCYPFFLLSWKHLSHSLWFPCQNCSPQSSESTEPPGSPQDCEMEITQTGEPPAPALYTQAPTYVYPGYMFGPPMYNVNGEYSLLDIPALLFRLEQCKGKKGFHEFWRNWILQNVIPIGMLNICNVLSVYYSDTSANEDNSFRNHIH